MGKGEGKSIPRGKEMYRKVPSSGTSWALSLELRLQSRLNIVDTGKHR